jgi:predicted nicotinamide N-methyase
MSIMGVIRFISAAMMPYGVHENPLATSLTEQLGRMRGGGDLPPALLDIVREELVLGSEQVTLVHPRDWDELRHQEGGSGRLPPYWALSWPSGQALAERVADLDLHGKRVLELGCGLGLASVVAARRGADVVATDAISDAVVFAAHNLAINDAGGNVAQVDWSDNPESLVSGAPWDLVIAADVLYLDANVDALVRLLPRLTGEVLLADPSRAGARDFLAAARRLFAIDTARDPVRDKVVVHRLVRDRGRA